MAENVLNDKNYKLYIFFSSNLHVRKLNHLLINSVMMLNYPYTEISNKLQ